MAKKGEVPRFCYACERITNHRCTTGTYKFDLLRTVVDVPQPDISATVSVLILEWECLTCNERSHFEGEVDPTAVVKACNEGLRAAIARKELDV